MRVFIRRLIFCFSITFSLKIKAKPLANPDPFNPSFDTFLPLASEADILSEQNPTYDVGFVDLFPSLTDPAELSAENPSCSTADDYLTWDSNYNPTDELWSDELWTRNLPLQEEETLSLDYPFITSSAPNSCNAPPATTTEDDRENSPQNPEPVVPDLVPLLYQQEDERGKCTKENRLVAACCATREGYHISDCWHYLFHIGWCLPNFQYCCQKLVPTLETIEGIDCVPVEWPPGPDLIVPDKAETSWPNF